MNRIPNLTELREHKDGYDTRYEIDTEHPLHNDPLVDPREPEFGFDDASSWYAKPHPAIGEALPGVPDAPLVRLDIARRLARAEAYLRTDPEVRSLLGAPAHIRIDDALRPYEAQKFAFYTAWPMILKNINPEITDEEAAAHVTRYVARPSDKPTPTPHLTGGAVDVALINFETGQPFDRGHVGGAVAGTAFPDFYEGYHVEPAEGTSANAPLQSEVAPASAEVILGRRVLYHAMTEVAGLSPNPNEIWHYGKGDPLSAYVSGSNKPYYGIAKVPAWYQEEMARFRPE